MNSVAPRLDEPSAGARVRPAQGSPDPGEGVATFLPRPPSVSAERILRIQGYADLTRVRPVIRQAADAMAASAERLSRPVVAWRRVPVRSLDAQGELALEGGVALHCPAFARLLAGCDAVAPFVLTVGRELCQEVVDLVEKGDLLEGLLLEAAGWLAIEDATRQFKSHLRDACVAAGRRMTSRLGPGYSYKVDGRMCGWGLEEQPALFALLEGGELPVTLLASCAMHPKMSRSGMYGIAPDNDAAAPEPVRGRTPRNANRGAAQ